MHSLPLWREMSAAQNGRVLQSCPKCGAANSESAQLCYVCDSPFTVAAENLAPAEEPVAERHYAPVDDYDAPERSLEESHEEELAPVAVSSSEPEWRLEVAHRLESYRKRRRVRNGEEESQTALPFVVNAAAAAPAERPRPRAEARAPRSMGIEIAVVQPSLDFSADEVAHPSAPLVPVAELDERSRAGMLDAVFLAGSYVGFLALFGSLGGQLTLGKLDAAVYGITMFLLYAQYFALFAIFNGSTPGMHLRGLRVVGFDGAEPNSTQLMWRSLGYLLSALTLGLGFLWALWDDDRLTWQDRISQTYITHAPEE